MTSRGRRAASALLVWLVLASLLTAQSPRPADRGLSHAAALRPIYDTILDANFGGAEELIAKDCSPREACLVLSAMSLWWQIQLDPDSRARDRLFSDRVEAAIAATEAWTTREPSRAEAWFYEGGAYGARLQWRVLRGEYLAAARDGKQAMDSLERALELQPRLYDANFGIGLYHYYADVAPATAKMVRWLLLLPGGDRKQGLKEMLEARNRGALLVGEADYQLHLVYLWYEGSTSRALELLSALRQKYPRNPLFIARLASIQEVYLHDHAASLATYRSLIDLARRRQVNHPELAEAQGRLGLATELDHLYESDLAIGELTRLIASRPFAPFGILARASFALGTAQERLGARSIAVTSYRSALEFARRQGLDDLAADARNALRRPPPDAKSTEAFRLSLQAWRLLQRGDLDQAQPLMARALALNPGDPVIEFRSAKLLSARGLPDAALESFERVIQAHAASPATFRAEACLEAGRLYESRNLERAAAMYRSAARTAGASQETREAATRSLESIASRVAASPAPR